MKGKKVTIRATGEHKGRSGVVIWTEVIGDEWQFETLVGIELEDGEEVQYYKNDLQIHS
ncbi:hypothetical protein QTG56_24305 (plasmid) [Rossellomorea sp. AcN35-11]|nr:hypothetical protein [Rossellomorea aquimaris]WJV31763.1 hypothetical protein QTG56_24305 [Rossellomorea sp. AcN35-11]